MSWNYPFTTRNSRDQMNTDRFSLIYDYMADMRRRMENSEQLINSLTTRIETLESLRSTDRIPGLFDFEPREPVTVRNRTSTRNNNTARNYNARTYNFTNTPRETETLTPLVDNIFNGILLDTINNTPRRGLSLENLNSNTSIELFIGNEGEGEREGEGEGAIEEPELCSICREPFANSSIIRKINYCGHKFHLSCIDTWFQNQYTCPICRVSVRITGNANENANENAI